MYSILGCNGQVGNDLLETLQPNTYGYGGKTFIDQTPDQFWAMLARDDRKFVVNCVAKTKPLEDCERFEHFPRTTDLNLNFLREVIHHCIFHNKILINFSTNNVYAEQMSTMREPATETFPRGPKGIYSMTKCWGEYLLEHYARTEGLRFFNLRVAAVHGMQGDNFIESVYRKLQHQSNVDLPVNQVTSFTTTRMISSAIKNLTKHSLAGFGHYNVAAHEGDSFYRIAQRALAARGIDVEKTIFPKVVNDSIRPEYSVMNVSKIGGMPTLADAISGYNEDTEGKLWEQKKQKNG